MRISKKILAIALSILMAVSMMPFTVFAATTGVTNGAELKAAVESAASGDTIEFTADNTTYPGTAGALVIDVNGKDITIDLNGHTQYFRVSGETTVVYETALFVIHNGAKLTITDSVGGGAMYMTYGANSPAYMFVLKDNPTKNVTDTTHTSELVIDGGKFVSDSPNYGGITIYQNYAGATTTINDGEFETNKGAANRRDYIVNDSRGEVEINGGTFTTSSSFDYVVNEGNTAQTSLTINGGTFNGTMSLNTTTATTELNGGTYKTYDGVTANTAVSAYLPADQIVDSTTGQIKNVDPSTVARTNSAEFTSLKDALDSVAAGATATITLLADCTLPATYEIADNQKITIDLNGNDITTTARAFNIRHGQLTLKGTGNLNANFTNANAAVAVYGAATDSGSNYSTFTLTSPATINAPNGYGAMIGATSGAAYGAKLQLGGTINSKYGVYINGNVAEPAVKTNAAAINITGTVTASNENAVVYAAGYAKWNINSTANLTGGSGVYIKSGTMNIAGNITATGAKTDYKFNANGAEATGDAVIIDSCGYPGNVPTVAIKAGTITSANGAAVASYAKQDDPLYPTADFPRVDEVIPATSTAVFSSDVTDLAAEGYETVYDTNAGGFVIAEDTHTVAKIGDAKYDTLKEAFAAAVDGDTITLVQDCDGDGIVVPQGKFNTNGLTVDFNGFTYDISGNPVGSTGTETLGFQLLKDNKLTFKDGAITTSNHLHVLRVIQNYSDLTLDNMDISMKGAYYDEKTVSNANGTMNIVNGSTVNAPDYSWIDPSYTDSSVFGGEALTVGTFATYTAATVNVEDSTINGDMSVDVDNPTVGTNTVNLTSGTLTGDIKMLDNAGADTVEVNKENTFSQDPAEGYKWVDNNDGTSTLAKVEDSVSITTADKVNANIYIEDTGVSAIKYTFNQTPDEEGNDQEEITVPVSDLTKNAQGQYEYTIEVAPAQIKDNITVKVINNNNEVDRTYNTSVAGYCDQIIAGDYDANTKALAKAVLDYGKAASAFFNYNTAAFTADYNNAGAFDWTAVDKTNWAASITGDITVSEVRYVATATPDLRFVVGYDEATAANLTAETDKGYEAKFVKVDDAVILQVTGIPAAKLNETITVTVSDGSTITYTPLIYAYNASKSDNAALAQLGNSIGFYWQAADAVFNV